MELNLAEENRIEWRSVDLLSTSSLQVIRSLINHGWIIRCGSLKSIYSVENSKGKIANKNKKKNWIKGQKYSSSTSRTFLNVSVRSFGFLFVYDFHMWGGMAERRKPRPPLETVLKLILFLLKYQNHIILLQLGYSL